MRHPPRHARDVSVNVGAGGNRHASGQVESNQTSLAVQGLDLRSRDAVPKSEVEVEEAEEAGSAFNDPDADDGVDPALLGQVVYAQVKVNAHED